MQARVVLRSQYSPLLRRLDDRLGLGGAGALLMTGAGGGVGLVCTALCTGCAFAAAGGVLGAGGATGATTGGGGVFLVRTVAWPKDALLLHDACMTPPDSMSRYLAFFMLFFGWFQE